jgi:DNA-binding NtrC family response regulator
MQALQEHDWPGNVRELQNYIERVVVMAESDELTLDLLPELAPGRHRPRAGAPAGWDVERLAYEVVQQGLAASAADEDNLHTKIVDRVERELIAQVMLACNNVQTKAAAKLGINRNTLHKKLKDYQLDV